MINERGKFCFAKTHRHLGYDKHPMGSQVKKTEN